MIDTPVPPELVTAVTPVAAMPTPAADDTVMIPAPPTTPTLLTPAAPRTMAMPVDDGHVTVPVWPTTTPGLVIHHAQGMHVAWPCTLAHEPSGQALAQFLRSGDAHACAEDLRGTVDWTRAADQLATDRHVLREVRRLASAHGGKVVTAGQVTA